jgi:hypothetical protein
MTYYPYKDKNWMLEHYVRRRMNLKDIAELLKKDYNIKTTPQTLYNWAEKFDLLKFRGKGRKMGANTQVRNPMIKRGKPKSAGMTQAKAQMEAMKRRNRMRKKTR